jgi:uncharacterized protein
MTMEAFLLGLSSAASCLVSCAPFFVPALALESGSSRGRRSALLGLFLAGRLASYACVGALVGAIGAVAAGFLAPETDRLILRAGWAIGGLLLLLGGLAGFEGHALCKRLAAREHPGASALGLGVAAGLNVCPPFLAASGRAAALGLAGGAAYFALFFVGTSIWMLPIPLLPRLRAKASELRSVARVAMVLLGIYFLVILALLGWS